MLTFQDNLDGNREALQQSSSEIGQVYVRWEVSTNISYSNTKKLDLFHEYSIIIDNNCNSKGTWV